MIKTDSLPKTFQPWETAARGQAKELGFSIGKDKNGKVELRRSSREAGDSVVLPFSWEQKSWGDCYTRIRNIYVYVMQGFLLVDAAELADSKTSRKNRDYSIYGASGFIDGNFYKYFPEQIFKQ